jgi:hypothetical protein
MVREKKAVNMLLSMITSVKSLKTHIPNHRGNMYNTYSEKGSV